MDVGAKAPSDTDWEYVDIFLFSNGQQQTPPRKYHLRTSELNTWTDTLRKLAEEQYDAIFSTIDIYTVEGRKVLTPMQISHGMAYVAVPPKDTFLPAGYNDYLLKASRSREKRKSANLSFAALVESGILNNKTDVQIAEEKESKILEEEKEISATIINPPNAARRMSIFSGKNISRIAKPSERKISIAKTTLPPQPPQKETTAVPQAFKRKTSMKTKDNNIIRRNLKINTSSNLQSQQITQPTVPTENNNNSVDPIKTKVNSKTNKTSDVQTSSKKFIEPSNIVDATLYRNILHEKNTITEDSVLGHVLDDQELIVVKNPESEIASVFLERNRSSSVYKQSRSTPGSVLTPINESTISEINIEVPLTVMDHKTDDDNIKPEIVLANNAKSVSENNQVGLKYDKSTSDTFLTVIERRDVINLNLKIDVRTCDGASNAQCLNCQTKLHCITEKSSQTNVDQVNINCIAKPSQLNNDLTTDSTPVEDKISSKALVLHCTCCVCSDAEKPRDPNCIILIPTSMLEKSAEIPKWNQNTNEPSGQPNTTRRSTENPIKKVYGCTWLHGVCENIDKAKSENPVNDEDGKVTKSASKDIGTNDVGVVSSRSKVPMKEDYNINVCNVVTDDDKKISLPNIEKVCSKQLLRTNSGTVTNKSMVDNFKKTSDNYSQTDWCSMLLEVRQHADGNYSFHLPPLQVLKYYGF